MRWQQVCMLIWRCCSGCSVPCRELERVRDGRGAVSIYIGVFDWWGSDNRVQLLQARSCLLCCFCKVVFVLGIIDGPESA